MREETETEVIITCDYCPVVVIRITKPEDGYAPGGAWCGCSITNVADSNHEKKKVSKEGRTLHGVIWRNRLIWSLIFLGAVILMDVLG